jgi:glucose dehydrogenase
MRACVWVGVLLTAVSALSGGAQQPPTARRGADWPMYRHDLAGTGYSPLTQINIQNVATLHR